MKKKPTTEKIQELRDSIEKRLVNMVNKANNKFIPLKGRYECLIDEELIPIEYIGKGVVIDNKGVTHKFSRLSLEELGEIDDMVDPPQI